MTARFSPSVAKTRGHRPRLQWEGRRLCPVERLLRSNLRQKCINHLEEIRGVFLAGIVPKTRERDDAGLGQSFLQFFLCVGRDNRASATEDIDDWSFDLPHKTPQLSRNEAIPDFGVPFPNHPAVRAWFRAKVSERAQHVL